MNMMLYPSSEAKQSEMLLPNHWERKRLRYLSGRPIRNGLGETANSSDPECPRYIRITDIAGPRQLHPDTFRSLPIEVAMNALVYKNDILISAVGATYGKSFYARNLNGDACFAGYLVRVSPGPEIDPSFLAYWTESQDYWEQINANVIQSTIQNFSAAKVRHLNAPIPPLVTQQRIASFLDERTAQIDGLLKKKQRLLDLLTEKRQAIITQAVTKGIDLDGSTKTERASCTETIDDNDKMIFSPNKETQRLKWAFSSCKNGAWGMEPDGQSDVICIRAADFNGTLGHLNDGKRTSRSVDSETYKRLMLECGDIILEKSGGGEKQLVGRAAIYNSNKPSITSNFLARCRPTSDMAPAFINYLLLAIYNGRGTFPHLKQSTGIQNLDLSSFLDIQVWLPSFDIQLQVAQFLDEKTTQIDKLHSLVAHSINKLFEYRSALITAAVTGQMEELR